MNHTEKLEQRVVELESELERVKRTVTAHWATRARLMMALEGIEGFSKRALDYEDDYREGYNKAHGLE